MFQREHYNRQMEALHAELRALGQMVVASITWSLGAFHRHDTAIARRVIADDKDIDHAQQVLEEHVIGVIATQQPVAGDLRRLIAMIEIASELERIGDYAKSVAKITVREGEPLELAVPAGIFEMSDRALQMLNSSLEAFIRQDVAAAQQLAAADDQVDALQEQVRVALFEGLQQSPGQSSWVADLLMLSHSIERIADRATNIGERVIFMVQGTQIELNA